VYSSKTGRVGRKMHESFAAGVKDRCIVADGNRGVSLVCCLFRSRQQPDGFYSAHASSLAAALRWGALRAAASRPCLGTSCRVLFRSRRQPVGCAPRGRTTCGGRSALPRHVPCLGLHITAVVIPVKTGIQGLRRHCVPEEWIPAFARMTREEVYSGSENGPPKADKLFDQQTRTA